MNETGTFSLNSSNNGNISEKLENGTSSAVVASKFTSVLSYFDYSIMSAILIFAVASNSISIQTFAVSD